ncbi:MFS general substrate transporter [Ascobolus immersus RN42]|uniref:MFS general substrate transporter n=1 Tax=Ascobolus immersus RN42 TaxID=1160509 RepID=A0A3N4I893_ASCIM|nr:MFS general substrate transporter [Ascobolus immersus RN42]
MADNSETPIRPSPQLHRTSTPHYRTFPTTPPRDAGNPPLSPSSLPDSHQSDSDGDAVPYKQLAVLAFIALVEQTALNSIAPYLPQMLGSFPSVPEHRIGAAVGAVASGFAFAQMLSNFFWGALSDRVGRKPVILFGAFATCISFIAFGLVKNVTGAIAVQVGLGLCNGNQAVVSTVLGELTDTSNQAEIFKYLPVIYGLGAIAGPLLGGALAGGTLGGDHGIQDPRLFEKHPYLLPNLVCAVLLALEFIVVGIFFHESLGSIKDLPPLGERIKSLFAWIWQYSSGSRRPSYIRVLSQPDARPRRPSHLSHRSSMEAPLLDSALPNPSDNHTPATYRQLLTPRTILLLATVTIFMFSDVTFAALYPIYASSRPPSGRFLLPRTIGITLSISNIFSMLFQLIFFNPIQSQIGTLHSYQLATFILAGAFFAMPAAANPAGLTAGLVMKNLGLVVGLTTSLLLVTNSAPNHESLGTLNGLAQTLGALGRAIGPITAGSMWSLIEGADNGGKEWLIWGGLGCVSALGGVLALGLTKWKKDYKRDAEEVDEEDEEESNGANGANGNGNGV